ncbi:hypothetical protein Ciccas_000876 [Cichlidogyrus casuarinus]|uniref:Uncharacterized protein n=1 Tax=Cichlidogyrus casuarinus TaxID=1844966 RepID=A0ABD2QNV4_9PLAT
MKPLKNNPLDRMTARQEILQARKEARRERALALKEKCEMQEKIKQDIIKKEAEKRKREIQKEEILLKREIEKLKQERLRQKASIMQASPHETGQICRKKKEICKVLHRPIDENVQVTIPIPHQLRVEAPQSFDNLERMMLLKKYYIIWVDYHNSLKIRVLHFHLAKEIRLKRMTLKKLFFKYRDIRLQREIEAGKKILQIEDLKLEKARAHFERSVQRRFLYDWADKTRQLKKYKQFSEVNDAMHSKTNLLMEKLASYSRQEDNEESKPVQSSKIGKITNKEYPSSTKPNLDMVLEPLKSRSLKNTEVTLRKQREKIKEQNEFIQQLKSKQKIDQLLVENQAIKLAESPDASVITLARIDEPEPVSAHAKFIKAPKMNIGYKFNPIAKGDSERAKERSRVRKARLEKQENEKEEKQRLILENLKIQEIEQKRLKDEKEKERIRQHLEAEKRKEEAKKKMEIASEHSKMRIKKFYALIPWYKLLKKMDAFALFLDEKRNLSLLKKSPEEITGGFHEVQMDVS